MALTARLRLRAKQATYAVLSRAYGFDKWHYRVVRENCRYFEGVRALHRKLKPATTVEVGCGLGEIVSSLESPVLIGVDRDEAVIRAARLLRRSAVTFLHVSELERLQALLDDSRASVCLLFLNWFHVHSPEELPRIAGGYVAKTKATHIIFDVIDETMRGYRYRHSPEALRQLGSTVAIRDAGDGIRRLVAIRVADGSESGQGHDAS